MSASDLDALKDELATAARILNRHGLIGMFGHISVLQPGDRRYLVHPGAGSRKDRCRPSDLFDLDLDEEWKPGHPLELYMHSEMHRLYPEVRSCAHVHAPYLTQLSVLADIPNDSLTLNAGFWPDRVPVYDEPDLVRDRETAQRLVRLQGRDTVCVLRWHGAMVAAPSIRQAVVRCIHAEENARLLLGTMALGRRIVPLMHGEERKAMYAKIATPKHLASYWQFESSLVELAPTGPGV